MLKGISLTFVCFTAHCLPENTMILGILCRPYQCLQILRFVGQKLSHTVFQNEFYVLTPMLCMHGRAEKK